MNHSRDSGIVSPQSSVSPEPANDTLVASIESVLDDISCNFQLRNQVEPNDFISTDEDSSNGRNDDSSINSAIESRDFQLEFGLTSENVAATEKLSLEKTSEILTRSVQNENEAETEPGKKVSANRIGKERFGLSLGDR